MPPLRNADRKRPYRLPELWLRLQRRLTAATPGVLGRLCLSLVLYLVEKGPAPLFSGAEKWGALHYKRAIVLRVDGEVLAVEKLSNGATEFAG